MSVRDDFATLVAAGDRCDLGRAALAIARIAYPDLEPAPYLARLDELADGARPRLAGGLPAAEAGLALATYLFRDLGFRGNQDDYYDPRNSFLNDVLDRRTGIPISLAVLLIETAARLGFSVEGVGFPGHFLVRAGEVLFDPFYGGRIVGPEELLTRYRALRDTPVASLPADALATIDRPAILARMLRNLVRVYLERNEHTRALEAVDLLLVLVPDSAGEVRLRGLLYEQLECAAAALSDFRRYLTLDPNAADADAIRERIERLTRATVTLH
jgi:regulator of sirC expression with transglutaminase-like and TPR domain